MLDKFQRPLLVIGVLLTGYLLLLQWDADYSTPAEAPPITDAFIEKDIPNNDDVPSGDSLAPASADSSDIVDVPDTQLDDSPSTSSQQSLIRIESDKLRLLVNLQGGDIVRAELKDYKEQRDQDQSLLLLRDDRQRLSVAQSGLIGESGFDSQVPGRPLYTSENNNYLMPPGQSQLEVPLTFVQDGVEVTKIFVLYRGQHDLDIVFRVNNGGSEVWRANMFGQFKRDSERPSYEKAVFGTRSYTGAAFSSAEDNYNKVDFEDMESRTYQESTKGGWVAMVQHYFVAAMVPDKLGNEYAYSARQTAKSDYIFGFVGPTFAVAADRQYEDKINLYLGPKSKAPLDALAEHLALTIDYGWLWYISEPLFSFLNFVHGYVGNWGLAIMIMTLIIKLVFFPLTNASYKSMARMRKLQPQMQQIRAKFGDNRQQMQKEVMELYKREKVNPLGGCLPIVIQMPIFISFYWALIESVELRHAPLALWIHDLSAQDPYYVLPLLMGASMFVQQLFSPAPADPTQARIMKLLPVFFTIFFLWFPAGLVLYWLVNNILSIAQQYIINRRLGVSVTPDLKSLFGGGDKKAGADAGKTTPHTAANKSAVDKQSNQAQAKQDNQNNGQQPINPTNSSEPAQVHTPKPFKKKKHRR